MHWAQLRQQTKCQDFTKLGKLIIDRKRLPLQAGRLVRLIRNDSSVATLFSWRRSNLTSLSPTCNCVMAVAYCDEHFTSKKQLKILMAVSVIPMQIWPAIDLRGGKCVRLRQGDYGQETVFGDDPAAMASRWVEGGADCLHLVDLDGARDGRPSNLAAISSILAAVNVPCQLGGGIRDEATIRELVTLGVSRLVIGTKALKEPDWFRAMCRKFPHRLALGIDARNGRVATDGWLKDSDTSATQLAQQFDNEPLAGIIYTDIAKDGMMAGPNLEAMAEMKNAVQLPVIASGGVTTAEDVTNLARIPMAGAIIGRTLYEGQLTLADALRAARVTD